MKVFNSLSSFPEPFWSSFWVYKWTQLSCFGFWDKSTCRLMKRIQQQCFVLSTHCKFLIVFQVWIRNFRVAVFRIMGKLRIPVKSESSLLIYFLFISFILLIRGKRQVPLPIPPNTPKQNKAWFWVVTQSYVTTVFWGHWVKLPIQGPCYWSFEIPADHHIDWSLASQKSGSSFLPFWFMVPR